MRNKTLTALLIVLAAAGVEAQTCQSVLKLAMGEVGVEDVIIQTEARAIKSDILSVIKSLQSLEEETGQHHHAFPSYAFVACPLSLLPKETSLLSIPTTFLYGICRPSVGKNICIRAPSLLF